MQRATWLVTGVSRGIGLALVKEILRRGHNVIGACRHPDGQRDLWEIKGDYKDRFQSMKLDVTNEASIREFSQVLNGRVIDVLVNNAGVLKDADSDLSTLDSFSLRQSLDVNTIGPLLLTKALLPNLKGSSNPKVINITSLMGSLSDNQSGGYYGYRMSKTALNMFSVCLAREFRDLTVLAMHPGWVKTDMGGPKAPTETIDSARGIVEIVEKATPKESGTYLDFRGRVLPW